MTAQKSKKDFDWEKKNNQLVALINEGRVAEAEDLGQELVDFVDKKYRRAHENKATSYNNMGMVFLLNHEYALSEKCFQEALKMRKQLLGDEHNDVALIYLNLMQLYKVQAQEILMVNRVETDITPV